MNYIKNKLFIDKFSVDKIIKKFGTPSYCYSYDELKKNVLNFKKNFNKINPLICFSWQNQTLRCIKFKSY